MINGLDFGRQFAEMFGIQEVPTPAMAGGGSAVREVRPKLYHDVCDVCGRTLLTGEKIEVFKNPEFEGHVLVCCTCREAARSSGFSKVA